MSRSSVGPFTDGDNHPIPGAEPPRPCPFCGAGPEDIVVQQHEPGQSWHGDCLHCGMEGPPGDTALEATQVWNRRGSAEADCLPTDRTSARIRAFLSSMQPLSGVAGLEGEQEFRRGRALIERLADSAEADHAPTLRLSPAQCADVVHFLAEIEPVEPASWWTDPQDAASHAVGLKFILEALEASLRRYTDAAAGEPGPGRQS